MKNLSSLTPDEVCAWIQKQIRRLFGDKVENASSVYASHGYYYIKIPNYHQLIVRRKAAGQFWKKLVKAK